MKKKNLREILAAEPIEGLVYRLHAESPAMQTRICSELGRRGDAARAPAGKEIESLLASPDGDVRAAAVEALGDIGHVEAAPKIAEILGDVLQPQTVRDTAAYVLGSLSYRAGIPSLLRALSASEPTVRRCAIAALVSIRDGSASLPLLLASFTEVDPRIQSEMRRAARIILASEPGFAVSGLRRSDAMNEQLSQSYLSDERGESGRTDRDIPRYRIQLLEYSTSASSWKISTLGEKGPGSMKLLVKNLKTGEVVREVDATGKSERMVEKVMLGMLRNMSDEYYIDDSQIVHGPETNWRKSKF